MKRIQNQHKCHDVDSAHHLVMPKRSTWLKLSRPTKVLSGKQDPKKNRQLIISEEAR